MSRKTIEAFKDATNWIGSGVVVATGFLLPDPSLTPVIWLGYEAAYLLVVPRTAWFQRRLRQKREAALAHHRESLRHQVWQRLLPEDRRRFEALERTRSEIDQQAKASSIPPEMLRQMNDLLPRFLEFAEKRAEYLEYLRGLMKQEVGITASRQGWWGGTGPAADRGRPGEAMLQRLLQHYKEEIATVRQALAGETPGSADVRQNNLRVLQQCQENLTQMGTILHDLDQQMELVVNTFTLINSQARTRPPEQLLSEVREVVGSAEALREAMATLAPLEQAVQRLGRE
jgi:hypothetical protein